MHPLIKQNPKARKLYNRLKDLYQLDSKIGQQLLGMGKHERRKLENLRDQVRNEIRSIDIWEPVREELRTKETPSE